MKDRQVFPDTIGQDNEPRFFTYGGLTKRELFAALIMQGVWSNAHSLAAISDAAKKDNVGSSVIIAQVALEQADALITELAK